VASKYMWDPSNPGRSCLNYMGYGTGARRVAEAAPEWTSLPGDVVFDQLRDIMKEVHLESKFFAPHRNSAHGGTEFFTTQRNSPICSAEACALAHNTYDAYITPHSYTYYCGTFGTLIIDVFA
jgi:hypothetical protein